MLFRILLDVVLLALALLVLSWPLVVGSIVAMFVFRSYETVVFGLILDLILAPGGGVLGPYHYTALLLIAAAGVFTLRHALYGSRDY